MSERERADETLEALARSAPGDDAALGALLERIRPRVYRWALARTGHPDDAEDVAQSVLLSLHRHLAGFEGRARFTTWLYRITANACTAFLRGRDRRRQVDVEELRRSIEDRAPPGPDARLDARRLAALVRVFCEELPDRQRTVFDLADLQGHAPAEIAAMLELEPVTVRTHLHRARRAIRERILALEDGPDRGAP
ncbi:MAG: RNA polymerase sigma factor [Gemmatimonadota bacterium]|nr:RNA polymerase sigma factor [Gemmatimonadota bacterium]